MKKVIFIFFGLIILSIISFFFLSRSESVKFNETDLHGKISISVPEYLFKTDSIDASALLQFKNEKKRIFLVIYEEQDTLSLSLQDFFKKCSDTYISHIDKGVLIKYFPEKINGYDTFIGNIKGESNGSKVYYRIAVVKSSTSFYKIVVGSSEKNRNLYDEDMYTIIRSFKVRT